VNQTIEAKWKRTSELLGELQREKTELEIQFVAERSCHRLAKVELARTQVALASARRSLASLQLEQAQRDLARAKWESRSGEKYQPPWHDLIGEP